MAARSVGIANAASQVSKALPRQGRAPSGTEEVGVDVEQVVAVISVAGAGSGGRIGRARGWQEAVSPARCAECRVLQGHTSQPQQDDSRR